MTGQKKEPHLVVVRGEPTEEELAALTAVLSARAAAHSAATAQAPEPRRTTSGWRDRSRGMRTHPRPGPGAWRMSTR